MDRYHHYSSNSNTNNVIDITSATNKNHDPDVSHNDQTSNDKKSFLQRLGEVNVMPDGMVSAIDETDRVILAIQKGAEIEQSEQENDR